MLISILHKAAYAKTLAKCLSLDGDRVHASEFAFGKAQVFFPQFADNCCEACLLLEVAHETLPREASYTGTGHPLRQFVSPAPYTSGAIMALAMAKAFEKVLAADDHNALQLEISIVAAPASVDTATLNAWFRPLGLQLSIEQHAMEVSGNAACFDLKLRGKQTLPVALRQIMVLLRAMDLDHIYWMGTAETQKFVELAEECLKDHPHLEAIKVHLAHYPNFQNRSDLGNLFEEDDMAPTPPLHFAQGKAELQATILQLVVPLLQEKAAPAVLLLNAESADWLSTIAAETYVNKVTLTHANLQMLQHILHQLNQNTEIPVDHKRKMALIPSAPTFKNPQFLGNVAVIVMGIRAGFPSWHWAAIEQMVLGYLQPQRLIWIEHDATQFENWASGIAKTFPYTLQLLSLGAEFPNLHIAIFDANETH